MKPFLLDMASFIGLYHEKLNTAPTHEKAYDATEEEFYKLYNHNKYKNFESFRTAKNAWLQRQTLKDKK